MLRVTYVGTLCFRFHKYAMKCENDELLANSGPVRRFRITASAYLIQARTEKYIRR